MNKTVLLNELVDIYLGLTHTPEYVLNGVPFLSVKDISNGNIDFSKCSYITEEKYNSLPNGAKPQIGDMLFCRVGTIGKPVIIEPETPKFGSFVSLGYFRLKKNDLCKLKYLYYWMYSDSFFSQVKKNVKGASQVNLNTGWLSKFEIPLYSIEEQKDIISKLEHLDDLISTRKSQLDKLDMLVKSRFVELFGDINVNDKGWDIQPLGELCTIVRGGSPRPIEKYLGGDIPWIKIGDATDGENIYLHSTKEHIIQAGVSKSRMVKAGSLIFANCGVSLGFARIITFDGCIHDGWLAMEDIDERLDKVFLLQALNQMTDHFRRIAPAGTQPNLNTAIMKAYKQIIPPVELQREFIAFVEQTDKSKLAVQQSLEQLEILKKSLMQQYFG